MKIRIEFRIVDCDTCRVRIVEIPWYAPHIHDTKIILSERMRVDVANFLPDTVKGAAIAVKEYRPWYVKLWSGRNAP